MTAWTPRATSNPNVRCHVSGGRAAIRAAHNYEVPEIVVGRDRAEVYLAWINVVTR
jgi:uncharacterized protein involved in tolerance to divalent cations